jgi:WD40 repeat protein
MVKIAPLHSSGSTKRRGIRLATGILTIALTLEWGAGSSLLCAAQNSAPSPQLHGVISRSRLLPVLRAPAQEIRFSPDGKYILLQVESMISVLAREPLSIRLSITTPQPVLARFSADSKSLIAATKALSIRRYQLDTGWTSNETPPLAPSGCLAAELSPDGELAACYDPDSRLNILRTATGEQIFSEYFGGPTSNHVRSPVPRGTGSAFAEPFGYFYAASLKGWIGRRDFHMEIKFSPNGRFVLARNSSGNVFCVEISTLAKIGITRGLGGKLGQPWGFVAQDKILALHSKKGGESEVLTFPDGKVLTHWPVTGVGVVALSQPRYVRIDSSSDGNSSKIFDTESREFLKPPYDGSTDIFENFAVTYYTDGEVALYRIGESQPFDRLTLPPRPLPTLRVAAVSPNLQSLSLSTRSAGAVYRVATGEQVESNSVMKGAWYVDDGLVNTLYDLPLESLIRVQQLQVASGKASQVWSKDNFFPGDDLPDDLRASGPVLLAVVPMRYSSKGGDVGLQLKSTQAYQLRAQAMENGKLLWTRSFTQDVPTPFADPQGDRVVLGWVATSETAKSETKKLRKEFAGLRKSNLTDHDTFFEVLDSRSGKTVGAAFAQIGAGPEEFEFVFAAGDSLILVKDEIRITVLTLSTGQVAARLTGSIPAASGATNLLAVSDGRRLTLYDLKTGIKRDEYLLPDEMAYLHFSASGKQLFVLTTHEIAFVLDVAPTSGSATAEGKHPE